MANRTVKDAHSIKGTNPQYLVEKITRTRIYESKYWKEQCFALTAELLVDKAMKLRYVGGIYGGNVKPTPFLCLLLKMLQIQPEKDIVIYFITQQDYKYTRALGAIYLRLTGSSMDCYKYLEPLLLDYRKIRRMNTNGEYVLSHMDEFIDELLHEERSCEIILPRIQKRQVMEETNMLEPRVSALDDDLEDMDSSEDDEEDGEMKDADPYSSMGDKRAIRDWDRPRRSPSPRYRRSPSPHRRGDRRMDWEQNDYNNQYGGMHSHGGGYGPSHGDYMHDRDRHRGDRDRDRERDRDRDRDRRRSRSRERHSHKHRDKDKDKRRSHKHKDDDDDRHHHHHHHKSSKRSRRDHDESREDMEIRLANEQRAKLGLAPLRP